MFTPRKVLRILTGLLIVLLLTSLGHLMHTSQQLDDALQSVRAVQTELSAAQDSLSHVRTELRSLAGQLRQREAALHYIREQVARLHTQYQADRAHAQKRTQVIKAELQEKEIALRQLHEEAQQFSQP